MMIRRKRKKHKSAATQHHTLPNKLLQPHNTITPTDTADVNFKKSVYSWMFLRPPAQAAFTPPHSKAVCINWWYLAPSHLQLFGASSWHQAVGFSHCLLHQDMPSVNSVCHVMGFHSFIFTHLNVWLGTDAGGISSLLILSLIFDINPVLSGVC